MRMSKRMDTLTPYLFMEISRKIAEKKAQGINVISFGIGDPDIPTADFIVGDMAAIETNSTYSVSGATEPTYTVAAADAGERPNQPRSATSGATRMSGW